jgi:hypothetical protein
MDEGPLLRNVGSSVCHSLFLLTGKEFRLRELQCNAQSGKEAAFGQDTLS